MRNRSIILAIVVLCGALSCVQKEEFVSERVTFRAVNGDSPSSKTTLLENGSVYWTPNDAINLFYGSTGSTQLTSNNRDTTSITSFSGTLDGFTPNGTDLFWAVYPYSAENSFDGTAVTVSLPATQTGVAGSFAKDLFISMACSADYTLSFYNLCGGVKFSVETPGIQYVTFRGNNGEVLAGTVHAAFDDNGKPQVTEVAEGATELRLDAPDGGFEVGKWYYIVSLPVTLSAGYTMTFFKNQEVLVERKKDKTVELKRSIWRRVTSADNISVSANKYLTFTSTGTTTLSLTNEGGNAPVLYYSTDAQSWTQWDYSDLSFTEAVPLYICGDNPNGFNFSNTQYSHFTATGDFFSISGDIMSLLNKDTDLLTIPNENCFLLLFYQCSRLTSGPSLPATTLTEACYKELFESCSNLETAPALPATTLAPHCYESMFYGCESLESAPELPALTMTSYCYADMFHGCLALGAAPELPATTLAEWCYYQMFFGCSMITEAPALPVTTLASRCYYGMFNGTGIATAPELPATVMEPYCYGMMFYACHNLVEAPALPATTLAEGCYESMFYACDKLASAPDLPAPALADYCYRGMFWDCTSLSYIKCLATDFTATDALPGMLNNVATQGTFVKDPNALWPTGVIPSGWTVQNSDGSPLMTASKYLTLTSTGSSTVHVNSYGDTAPALFYSYNRIDWIEWDFSSLTFTASTPLYLCGDNQDGFNFSADYYSSINFAGDPCAVSGDIMSLLDKDEDLREIPSDYCFYNLFSGSSNLTSAPSLPATYLTLGCYARMFEGCQSLVAAPSLPATCLSDQCYDNMFLDCQSLTTAPALPADTLATSCYYGMFTGCTSLAVAPDLPANNLTESCYAQMFVNCTSLVTAPEVLPAEVLSSSCYQGMFMGCSSLTTAPMLPAEVVAWDAYTLMFSNCTSLNYVVCLAYDIGASGTSASCVSQWMNNVAETGTFVKSPDSQWPTGDSGIPEGWTVEVMQ